MTKLMCFLLYPVLVTGWLVGLVWHMFVLGIMHARNCLVDAMEEMNK